jgi:hypothetical protein
MRQKISCDGCNKLVRSNNIHIVNGTEHFAIKQLCWICLCKDKSIERVPNYPFKTIEKVKHLLPNNTRKILAEANQI